MKVESKEIKIGVKEEEMKKEEIMLWLRKGSNGTWTVDGLVRDCETAEPIPDASVDLDSDTVLTNERGYFVYEDIAAGRHEISVRKEDYEATGNANKPSRVEFVL